MNQSETIEQELLKEMKVCTGCGLLFPSTPKYYHREDSNSTGLASQCKWCKKSVSTLKNRDVLEQAIYKAYASKSIKINIPEFLNTLTTDYAVKNGMSVSRFIAHLIIKELEMPEDVIEAVRRYSLPTDATEKKEFWKDNPKLKKMTMQAYSYKKPSGAKPKEFDSNKTNALKDILLLLIEVYPVGLTMQKIADNLGVSTKTIQRNLKPLRDTKMVIEGEALSFSSRELTFMLNKDSFPEQTLKLSDKTTPEPTPKEPKGVCGVSKSQEQLNLEEQEYYESKYGKEV